MVTVKMSDSKFEKQKSECLSGIDWSRKGSVDVPIQDLVQYINSLDQYFTTSSCSGRIMVFQQDDTSVIQKKGCEWLYTTHEDAELKPLVESLKNIKGNAVFKFEPFVLHVQCKCIEDAQKLHTVAVASGFRNSGITIGSKGKIITAVRSTHSMEVPLSNKGQLLVSEQYLDYLVQLANEKLHENFNRIQRFHDNLKEMVTSPDKQQSKDDKKQKRKEYKKEQDRIRNENKLKAKDCHTTVDDDMDLNFDCFDDNT